MLLAVTHLAAVIAMARLTSHVVALPRVVRRLAREEAEAQGDRLKEAVASKAGEAIIALTVHEERWAADLRARVAGSESRARMGEARTAESAKVLEDVKIVLGALRELLAAAAVERATQPTPEPPVEVAVEPVAAAPAPTSEPSRAAPGASGVLPRVYEEDGDSGDLTAVVDRAQVRCPTMLPPTRGAAAAPAPAGGGR
jgi:hypothetical protein